MCVYGVLQEGGCGCFFGFRVIITYVGAGSTDVNGDEATISRPIVHECGYKYTVETARRFLIRRVFCERRGDTRWCGVDLFRELAFGCATVICKRRILNVRNYVEKINNKYLNILKVNLYIVDKLVGL